MFKLNIVGRSIAISTAFVGSIALVVAAATWGMESLDHEVHYAHGVGTACGRTLMWARPASTR